MPSRVSQEIGIDGNNRLWILTYTDKKSLEFELFDENGIWLGEIPWVGLQVSSPVYLSMRIIGDRMFLIDQREEMAVYEYKIIEK